MNSRLGALDEALNVLRDARAMPQGALRQLAVRIACVRFRALAEAVAAYPTQ